MQLKKIFPSFLFIFLYLEISSAFLYGSTEDQMDEETSFTSFSTLTNPCPSKTQKPPTTSTPTIKKNRAIISHSQTYGTKRSCRTCDEGECKRHKDLSPKNNTGHQHRKGKEEIKYMSHEIDTAYDSKEKSLLIDSTVLQLQDALRSFGLSDIFDQAIMGVPFNNLIPRSSSEEDEWSVFSASDDEAEGNDLTVRYAPYQGRRDMASLCQSQKVLLKNRGDLEEDDWGFLYLSYDKKFPPSIQIGEGAEWQFNYYRHLPIINSFDYTLHHLLGAINQTVFNTPKNPGIPHDTLRISHINYLIMGLSAVFVSSNSDGSEGIKQVTFPIFYDSTQGYSGEYTLTPNENTEIVVYTSCPKDKKRQKDQDRIFRLSIDQPFDVKDIQGKSHKVFFDPFKLPGNHLYSRYKELFPSIKKYDNTDSEVQGLITLMENPSLFDEFTKLIHLNGMVGLKGFGLRFYSFLDTCDRCQELLIESQPKLKELFIRSLVNNTNLVRDELGQLPFL